MQSVHPGVQSYLDQVVSTLTIHVDAELIGVYLHGSLAMGAFDPRRSDIDILAVCAEPLHRERRMVLGEALAVIPTPPSGGDLEFSIQAFLGDIHWAKKEGAAAWEGHDMPELASMAYQVLNAARCWRYLESGELGSKVEGAAWLERRDPDPDARALLDAVSAYQRGGIPNHPDERTVSRLVERVEAMLRSAVS
jgi:Domain of unknown function (DUF4111)